MVKIQNHLRDGGAPSESDPLLAKTIETMLIEGGEGFETKVEAVSEWFISALATACPDEGRLELPAWSIRDLGALFTEDGEQLAREMAEHYSGLYYDRMLKARTFAVSTATETEKQLAAWLRSCISIFEVVTEKTGVPEGFRMIAQVEMARRAVIMPPTTPVQMALLAGTVLIDLAIGRSNAIVHRIYEEVRS